MWKKHLSFSEATDWRESNNESFFSEVVLSKNCSRLKKQRLFVHVWIFNFSPHGIKGEISFFFLIFKLNTIWSGKAD